MPAWATKFIGPNEMKFLEKSKSPVLSPTTFRIIFFVNFAVEDVGENHILQVASSIFLLKILPTLWQVLCILPFESQLKQFRASARLQTFQVARCGGACGGGTGSWALGRDRRDAQRRLWKMT